MLLDEFGYDHCHCFYRVDFQQLACDFWAFWLQYLKWGLAKNSSKARAQTLLISWLSCGFHLQELRDNNNFLEDDNIDASLFKYNLEFMTWNACVCHDLRYMNMPWLGMHGSTMTLDAWACHGLECMSVSRLRREGIESNFPSLSDDLRSFPFCPLE